MKGSELTNKLNILSHYLEEQNIPQMNENTTIITNQNSLIYCNKEKIVIVTKDNVIEERSRIEQKQEELIFEL